MQKKIIIPIIVIIFLLGVLAGVMMLEDSSSPNSSNVISSDASAENDTALETKGVISGIDSESITKVSVNTDGKSFAFVLNGDVWKSAGSNASVSSGAVDSLINSLGSIEYTETYSKDEMKRSDCGISDSSDTISITMTDRGELIIYRGMNTTDGSLCYMATSADEIIYLVPREAADRLFAPLDKYRNSAALNLDFDNITEIAVNNSGGLILARKGKANANAAVYNEWKLVSPIEVGANDELIQIKLIDSLKQIKISGYASDDGDFASFGFGTKDKYIELKSGDGRSARVYFSDKTGGRYYISVNNEPAIYEIAINDAPYIELGAIDIADRNINLAKMTNISSVSIKGENKDYTVEFLEKSGKINGKDVSYDDMNREIFPAVCGLFADDIYSGEHGASEIVIKYNYKDKSSDVLEFAPYNDRLYSVSKNGKLMYLILKTKVNDLTAKLDEYK